MFSRISQIVRFVFTVLSVNTASKIHHTVVEQTYHLSTETGHWHVPEGLQVLSRELQNSGVIQNVLDNKNIHF